MTNQCICTGIMSFSRVNRGLIEIHTAFRERCLNGTIVRRDDTVMRSVLAWEASVFVVVTGPVTVSAARAALAFQLNLGHLFRCQLVLKVHRTAGHVPASTRPRAKSCNRVCSDMWKAGGIVCSLVALSPPRCNRPVMNLGEQPIILSKGEGELTLEEPEVSSVGEGIVPLADGRPVDVLVEAL